MVFGEAAMTGTDNEAAQSFTVAADGTGDFKTISAAVAAAPVSSSTRFTINVKPGIYNENVEIPANKSFIALIGSGMDTTKITANRCAQGIPKYDIFHSATLAVNGPHFLLKDITVENSAGFGEKVGQAVAMLYSADYCVFYKSSILGYQDTLFANSGKQFYRECNIYGSVDFIFGAAAAVFQNCNLYARLHGSVFTAQSREKPSDMSASVIQHCWLKASPETTLSNVSSITADLGRPWRSFSTVVVMESWLGSFIMPEGWIPMGGTGGENVTYIEYNNRGDGANTSGRVKWKGYKALKHPSEASKIEVTPYTVSQLLGGDTWIPETGVKYTGGLFFN